ncbi:MAG: excinuclease ABC subunit UvrC [Tissierellia bacterium]|nr:excinuclease ABC subunit UvrC [Tissierellia bacterium]
MKDFKYELSRLPEKPGVYLMKDKDDKIIYVGKAKNLKNRVRSYFQSDSNKSMKVIKMVEKIENFEYIIVDTEVEALVLESNFIKEHRPHYNILLRDDKQYPYIMITDEKYPRVMKVRRVENDSNMYFGPYPNAFAVNDIIDLLQTIFKIRTCNLNFDKGARLKRPCLNYYIGKCPAPCVDKADEDLYMANIKSIIEFLKGKEDKLNTYLKDQMLYYSKNLMYERAALYRDYLASIQTLMEKQKVTNVNGQNIDVVAMFKKGPFVCMQIYFMRDGKVVDRKHYIMDDSWDDKEDEIMSSFMKQFYLNTSFVPKEILVDELPDERDVLEELLQDKMKRKVKIHQPQRGEKYQLIQMAAQNAQKMLDEFLKKREERERKKNLGLKNLEKTLNIFPINRIEAYDISNTSGVNSVGSMVVYEDGKKAKKEYRKFKIRTVEGADDYASMLEVLTRRFKRALSSQTDESGFGHLPDLIIMDGGKGHVNTAESVIETFGLDIQVIGLAKDDKHKTRAIVIKGREINLDKNSAVYRFLYDIQEEVHRFALDYHNRLRTSSITTSELSKIDGVGKKRIENLYKHFKTFKAIKDASLEELMQCDGINKTVAHNIYNYFRADKDEGI